MTGHDLIGMTALVGITTLDHQGTLVRREQFHGTIAAVTEREISIRLPDGTTRSLPPAPEAFSPARQGEYRLKSTGEVVVDPDLVSVWTLRQPAIH
jgi:hypothetical protein